MAAGLSLRRDDLEDFRLAFADAVAAFATPEILQPVRHFDGSLPTECFTLDFALHMRDCGPWGQHFPEPCFVGDFDIVQRRVLGERHLKYVLQVPGRDILLDGIHFSAPPALLQAAQAEKLRILYRLDVNEFRGRQSLQLLIELAEILPVRDV